MATAVPVRGGESPSTGAFELCRTIGHAWDQFYPDRLERPSVGWRFSLRCTRCSTERHDLISPINGSVMSRRYEWVEGYLMDKGVERPSREELRKHLFTTLRTQLRSHNQIAVAAAKTNGVKTNGNATAGASS